MLLQSGDTVKGVKAPVDAGKAAKTGWDGREVVTEATGSSITMDGKKYEFLGYDKNGSPVYQEAEILAEQSKQSEEKSKQADDGKPTEGEDGQNEVENSEDRDKMKIGFQFFAKNSQDYPTVTLERGEYAHVMSEIATNLTKEQAKLRTFSRAIGEYIYFVENNGFGEYRIFKKIKILEDK